MHSLSTSAQLATDTPLHQTTSIAFSTLLVVAAVSPAVVSAGDNNKAQFRAGKELSARGKCTSALDILTFKPERKSMARGRGESSVSSHQVSLLITVDSPEQEPVSEPPPLLVIARILPFARGLGSAGLRVAGRRVG
jgi:hypothetical protein